MTDKAEMNFTFTVGEDDELLVDCNYNIPEESDIELDDILDSVAMTLVAISDEEYGVNSEVH